MKCRVKGLAPEKLKTDLINAVEFASEKHFDGNLTFNRHPEIIGNYVHFTLRVNDSNGKGARFSRHRKLISACYHAHFWVMCYLYDMQPEMRLSSAMADYKNRKDFYDSYFKTGNRNIGSMMYPMSHSDTCHCSEHDSPMVRTVNRAHYSHTINN